MPNQPFKRGLFDTVILPGLLDAPESQISEEIRSSVKAFAATSPGALDIYNFLDRISRKPPTEISSFVQVLCDVRKYYSEPVRSIVNG